MTFCVAQLIASSVTPWNAKAIEQQAQAELCLAHASGDCQDYEAMLGKIHQCLAVKRKKPECGEPEFSLKDLLDALKVNV